MAPKLWRTVGGCNISWSSLLLIGVAGLIRGPDTGHLSEYGGRDDEDVAPREHDAAVLKKRIAGKLRMATPRETKTIPRTSTTRTTGIRSAFQPVSFIGTQGAL